MKNKKAEAKASYPVFTEEMKKDYTILIPNMLPVHFKLIGQVMNNYGYKVALLETAGRQIIDTGLKTVHNDTCYPALLVIGQFIDAIESGKYDINKLALLITQTGGGCRASNYIHLLRKALEKKGYGFIPVLSLNFSGLDKEYSFRFTLPMVFQMVYSILLGDLIMLLYNQTKPYEIEEGSSEAAEDEAFKICFSLFNKGKLVSYSKVKNKYKQILKIFNRIKLKNESKIKVGIVGEIYVKYSPLGNNALEKFLVSVGAEAVIPGLLDFCLYCIANTIIDQRLYGGKYIKASVYRLVYNWVVGKQTDVIRYIKKYSNFRPQESFDSTFKNADDYISPGVKMGEGWLLTAEMVELIHSGVENIICTQPFGCLPNHIAGKGMIRKIKEKNPNANIVAIDYDPGATKINQENRIKLMLSVAKRNMGEAVEEKQAEREELTLQKILINKAASAAETAKDIIINAADGTKNNTMVNKT